MAAVDEILFHQILAWHHFYDRATPFIALMSDGFLHAGELIALVAGFILVMKLLRQNALDSRFAWAGFFIGLGGFQMFDGIVDHKILRLHQIRYGVDTIIPYDLTWNAVGFVLLLTGAVLLIKARRAHG